MPRIGIDGRVLVDRYHGIGRVTYELLHELAGDPDLQFTIFVDPREPATRFDLGDLRARPGVEIVDFAVTLPSLPQFLRWPLALRRHRVDAMLYAYQLGASLVGGGRRLVVVHDCIFERDAAYAPTPSIRTQHMLLSRMLLRRATAVVPSRATADDLRDYYGVSDAHVVEWGVSERFAAPAGDRPLATPYLLHVGARRPHKNVPFLVRTLAGLGDDTHLVLVGSTDDRWPDDTMALARELGVADRVHERHGVTDDELSRYYRHARAFVYPSAIEGFGLPLLEAMSAGTPVVASDIPVFREIGEGAAEFAPLDPAAWAAAIRRLDDPDHRDAITARGAEVAAAATWRRSAATLRELLVTVPAR